jgi:polysaccharide biosynthesis protein PslJ
MTAPVATGTQAPTPSLVLSPTTVSLCVDERPLTDYRADGGGRPFLDAPRVLLGYLVLLFSIPADLTIPALGAAGSPAALYGIAMLFWWFVSRLRGAVTADRNPVRVAFCCFVVAALCSYAEGAARATTATELSNSDRAMLDLVSWAGILLVTLDGLRTRQQLNRVLGYLVVGGAVQAAIGFLQHSTSLNPPDYIAIPGLSANEEIAPLIQRSGFSRVTGMATHPIEFSVVVALLAAVGCALALDSRLSRRRRRWYGVCAVLMLITVPMAVARSGIVALLVLMIVIVPVLSSRQRTRFFIILPPALIAMRLAFPGLLGTIRSLFLSASTDPSTQGRTADYPVVETYAHARPIFGQGIGTFTPVLYRTLDNQLLGTLIEMGIVGLIALMAMPLTGFFAARRARRAVELQDDRLLGQVLAATVVAALAASFTFDSLSFSMFAGLFFVLLGLCGAFAEVTIPGGFSKRTAIRWTRRNVLACLGCALVILPIGASTVLWLRHKPVTWVSQGSALVSIRTTEDKNIYRGGVNTDPIADLLQRAGTLPSVREELSDRGYSANYEIAQGDGSLEPGTDQMGAGPVLRVQTQSTSAVEAQATLGAVTSELRQQLAQMQAKVHAPSDQLVELTNIAITQQPQAAHESHTRLLAACALLITIGWLLVSYAAITIANWRVRTRTSSATSPAEIRSSSRP